jgi:CRISPR-associated protein (TIGR03986 family)
MTDQSRNGVLRWDPSRQALFIDGEEKPKRVTRPDRDLIGDLAGQDPSSLDGITVSFERRGGQAREIRRFGAPAPAKRSKPADPDKFYNPYTFVPAAPRDHVPAALSDAKTAGLAGHGRIRADLWTGRIGVTLTTQTPLLLLDASRRSQAGGQGHFSYPVLTRDGSPHLPPTSVKGMLRSAYEAVTNSRLGVFEEHTDRLGLRMQASTALSMVPARVSDDGTSLILLPGDTRPRDQNRPILHAAWLPVYRGWDNLDHPAGWKPEHGAEVEAWVELFQHHRPEFQFWRVRAVWPVGEKARPESAATDPSRSGPKYAPLSGVALKRISGYVFYTNQNIKGKHDERIFFAGSQPEETVNLGEALRSQWEQVVRSYRAAHSDREINRIEKGERVPPSKYLCGEPGRTAWSPHQYDDTYLTLRPGALCYAMVDQAGKVIGVYPVMITRGLHDVSPRSLLPENLLPASSLDELSPADRVFGWVNSAGRGAYRGQLRIGPVTCDQGPDAVSSEEADFGAEGVPLAILGKPKPQQGRFYIAQHRAAQDRPLADATPKNQWYQSTRGLRGRKFYWHHAGLAGTYWKQPAEDRTQKVDDTGRYQEYRRPRKGHDDGTLTDDKRAFQIDDNAPEQRDEQNRSVRGWVKPGTTFRFTIEVTNLSTAELGALTWLLNLPPEHYHRVGYGKPLGFGSVRLDVDPSVTDLREGREWVGRYHALRLTDSPPGEAAVTAIMESAAAEFETAAAPEGQAKSAVLTAFLAVTSGDASVAVHYPRIRPQEMDDPGAGAAPVPPDPRGRSFEWFSLNEKEKNRKATQGRSLPLPSGGPLPVHTADDRPDHRRG